tara:strand:- start:67 stop:1002 length:936 start_codon:yes stop_codon:yes gene_type:complete
MNDINKDGVNLKYKVVSFYCFHSLTEEKIVSLIDDIKNHSSNHTILGTVLLSLEGINGTICGLSYEIDTLIFELKNQFPKKVMEIKYSYVDKQAFRKLKVKCKPEIVTMGIKKIDPNREVGNYINPLDWNEFVNDPNTLVIDTRNKYEICIGTFKGSLNPNTDNFRQFPLWVEKILRPLVNENPPKKIAMFCTGGIRCEKATSFLLKEGFSDIYHLHGGILRYLEVVPEKQSLWEGECFVFDQRVALDHQLSPGDHQLCYACGMPLNSEDRKELSYIRGVQCHYCKDLFTESDRLRFSERQKHYDKVLKGS